jgi:hypothetical protein
MAARITRIGDVSRILKKSNHISKKLQSGTDSLNRICPMQTLPLTSYGQTSVSFQFGNDLPDETETNLSLEIVPVKDSNGRY